MITGRITYGLGQVFNPTEAEANLLKQVVQRESSGNYQAIASICNPTCATGAYQFKDSTWQWVAQQTGVGTQYSSAADAPTSDQDVNALWLLRYAGGNPNASIAWGASGPYASTSGSGPLVDLSGSSAATPTSSILDQLQSSMSSAGIDLNSPTTDVLLAVGLGVAGVILARVL